MRFALFAVLLLSCAPAPRQYERGTPARPAPAPTRPGVGLPLPGQPRHEPQVQPQPKPKRYLPPEPDGKPGIWASEAPDSDNYEDEDVAPLRGKPISIPSIYLVPVPSPHSARDAAEASATAWCARRVKLEIDDALMGPRVSMLTLDKRRCFVAMAMGVCTRFLHDDIRGKRNSIAGVGGPLVKDIAEKAAFTAAAKSRATASIVETCSKSLFDPDLDQCWKDMGAHLDRKYGGNRMVH